MSSEIVLLPLSTAGHLKCQSFYLLASAPLAIPVNPVVKFKCTICLLKVYSLMFLLDDW